MAVRLIAGIRKRESSEPYYKKFGILKLTDIYAYSVSIFMHNYEKHKLPEIFNEFFCKNSDTHERNTRGSNKFRLPKFGCKISERFINVTGANIWNSISTKFPTNVSLNVFKGSMQKHLMETYKEIMD